MLQSVQIANRRLDVPIIQGGMGVGISLSGLAGAVMKEGGMGVLSAAHPGWNRPGFWKNSLACNLDAIREEVRKAREISGGQGLLGLNVMMALSHAEAYVRAGCEAGVDALLCGAGLPLELPVWTEGCDVLLAPIVSSARACSLICRRWKKRSNRLPDFVVVEGSEAGGHLGFDRKDLEAGQCRPLGQIVEEVCQVLAPYEKEAGHAIPVFAAGGVYTRNDIDALLQQGAAGVQMATRFIATRECDAPLAFKEQFVRCRREDLKIVSSPAGFPGRAIDMRNGIGTADKAASEEELKQQAVIQCTGCLKGCSPKTAVYCISKALIDSVSGHPENGLVFAGSNAWRIDRISSVPELFAELQQDLPFSGPGKEHEQ